MAPNAGSTVNGEFAVPLSGSAGAGGNLEGVLMLSFKAAVDASTLAGVGEGLNFPPFFCISKVFGGNPAAATFCCNSVSVKTAPVSLEL